ncbi:hypothetical protein C7K08_12070 [Synechococcus lacustris str. Tous]|uniref:Uncharacterized protein n=2 Tax=Synechococcus TaxID=1129 RepID=A0A2P7EBQ4_9SYNE|nr:hypothetical protein C7K08_12070 [Synechococcus lacustris str. Tous]
MQSNSPKKLALLLPYAVNIRDICYSGALKKLSSSEGLIIHIYTQEPELVPLYGCNVSVYTLVEYTDSWLDRQLKQLFSVFIYQHSYNYQALHDLTRISPLNLVQLSWHGFKHSLFRLILAINIHKFLLVLSFFLSNRILRKKKYLCDTDYHMVVSSRSVINSLEYGYILDAFFSKSKLILAAGSWDNFTTKVFVDFNSSGVLVWNSQMASELKEIYGFSDKKIVILGFPRFSQLLNVPKTPQSVHEPSPAFKILICLSYEDLTKCPHNNIPAEFVNALNFLDLLDKSPLNSESLQVTIRFHPFTKSDFVELFKSSTKRFSFPVQLYFPGISKKYFENFMSFVEDRVYSSQLQDANVVISCGSTVAIDSMVLRKHQINIGWDPPGFSDYRPITRIWGFPHLRSLVASTNLKVYRSSTDALDDITKCMDNEFIDPVDYEAFTRLYVPNSSPSSYASSFSDSITDLQ